MLTSLVHATQYEPVQQHLELLAAGVTQGNDMDKAQRVGRGGNAVPGRGTRDGNEVMSGWLVGLKTIVEVE